MSIQQSILQNFKIYNQNENFINLPVQIFNQTQNRQIYDSFSKQNSQNIKQKNFEFHFEKIKQDQKINITQLLKNKKQKSNETQSYQKKPNQINKNQQIEQSNLQNIDDSHIKIINQDNIQIDAWESESNSIIQINTQSQNNNQQKISLPNSIIQSSYNFFQNNETKCEMRPQSRSKYKSENNLKTVHTKSIETKSIEDQTVGAGRTSLKNNNEEKKSSQRSQIVTIFSFREIENQQKKQNNDFKVQIFSDNQGKQFAITSENKQSTEQEKIQKVKIDSKQKEFRFEQQKWKQTIKQKRKQKNHLQQALKNIEEQTDAQAQQINDSYNLQSKVILINQNENSDSDKSQNKDEDFCQFVQNQKGIFDEQNFSFFKKVSPDQNFETKLKMKEELQAIQKRHSLENDLLLLKQYRNFKQIPRIEINPQFQNSQIRHSSQRNFSLSQENTLRNSDANSFLHFD